jgi:hypothetical protein
MSVRSLRDLPFEDTQQLPPLLRAMWHDAHGAWAAAHEIAQGIDTPDGAWVHAFLHRREGDTPNAAYWYRRAGKPVRNGPPDAEWREIVEALSGGALSAV